MLPTSGTYNFLSIQVEILIREAFERIGILGEFIDPLRLESAKRSINLLLLEWMEKTTNLWTLQDAYLSLVPGQRQYTLPENLLNIIQANLRVSSRQLNGTPQTNTANTYDNGGGGIAVNAFDGNGNTACTQNVADGNISYDYGINNTETITFIGIQSNTTTLYTLIVESCPTDPTDLNSWSTLLVIPPQTFISGVNVWFDIPVPTSNRAYRVRETNGATLDIQEIFFNNNTYDYAISNVSRNEYNTYPNKYLQSRPSVYYLNRQITPILNIWPTAAIQYNCLYYSYKRMIQEVGLYTQTIEIPAKFYSALIWGLSWQLALKFNPQMAEMLENKYSQAFSIATIEDTESTPLTILGDIA